MNIGLTDITIAQIQDIFKSYTEVDEAILYGSRAKQNYKPNSDIDLTIKGNNLSFSTLNKISWQLDDLLLPYTFDLSLYNHITETDILDHIKRVGVTFYKKDQVLIS